MRSSAPIPCEGSTTQGSRAGPGLSCPCAGAARRGRLPPGRQTMKIPSLRNVCGNRRKRGFEYPCAPLTGRRRLSGPRKVVGRAPSRPGHRARGCTAPIPAISCRTFRPGLARCATWRRLPPRAALRTRCRSAATNLQSSSTSSAPSRRRPRRQVVDDQRGAGVVPCQEYARRHKPFGCSWGSVRCGATPKCQRQRLSSMCEHLSGRRAREFGRPRPEGLLATEDP
ncbi:hypothetical protein ABIA26_001660 [Sinorhizobium fredii]